MKKGCILTALFFTWLYIFAQEQPDLKPGIYMSIDDFRANHPSYAITELPDIITKLEENNDEYICVESIFYSDSAGFVSAMPAKKIWGFCTGFDVYVSVPDSIWNVIDFLKGATGKDPKAKENEVTFWSKVGCFYHVREIGAMSYIPKPVKRDYGSTNLDGTPAPRTPKPFGAPVLPGKTGIEYMQAFIDMKTGAFYKLTYDNIAQLIKERDPELYAEWHKKKEAKQLYYFYLTQYNRKHPLEFTSRQN